MDFDLPDEIEELRRTVRKFVDEAVIPVEHAIERDSAVPDSILCEAARLGLFGITIPEEYGGSGLAALGPAGPGAARAEAARLAGKQHEALEGAVGAPERCEAMGQQSASEELATLALDEPGQPGIFAVVRHLSQEGLQVGDGRRRRGQRDEPPDPRHRPMEVAGRSACRSSRASTIRARSARRRRG